jgi:hypothetical protein
LSYSEDELREIYDSTNGHCVYCRKKLAFSNYADYDERGAWEVAHSIFPKRVWNTDKIHVPIINLDISNLAPAYQINVVKSVLQGLGTRLQAVVVAPRQHT